MEEWVPAPSFEGIYEVSNLGRVRRIGGSPLRPFNARGGYARVTLCRPNAPQKSVTIHRLVCVAFNGPAPPGHEVNHLNNVRDDNRAENLEWVTRKQNLAQRKLFGTDYRMERNPSAKLTKGAVLAIRAACAAGAKQKVLAAQYGVTQALISAVALRKCWAEI